MAQSGEKGNAKESSGTGKVDRPLRGRRASCYKAAKESPHSKTQARVECCASATFWSAAIIRRFRTQVGNSLCWQTESHILPRCRSLPPFSGRTRRVMSLPALDVFRYRRHISKGTFFSQARTIRCSAAPASSGYARVRMEAGSVGRVLEPLSLRCAIASNCWRCREFV